MRPIHVVAGLILAAGTVACGTPTEPGDPLPGGEINPPVLSAITLAAVSPDTVRIAWTTDQPTTGTLLMYDREERPVQQSPLEPSLVTQHLRSVTGLVPGTAYTFAVFARNSRGMVTSSTPQAYTTPDFAPGLPESELQVTAFHVFEYESGGKWWYAPRVTVSEASGRRPAIVTEMRFTVTGQVGSATYRTSKCVEAGQQNLELLGEYYGSYELEMGGGSRASGHASAVITYYDRTMARATVTVTGPVIPGPPADHSGRSPIWNCRE